MTTEFKLGSKHRGPSARTEGLMQSTVRDIVSRSSRAAASFLFALLAIGGSRPASAQVPGGFTLSGNLAGVRASHTATLLNDGHVRVVGGGQGRDLLDGFDVVPGAEFIRSGHREFCSGRGTLRPAANQERCACRFLSRYSGALRLREYPARSSFAAW